MNKDRFTKTWSYGLLTMQSSYFNDGLTTVSQNWSHAIGSKITARLDSKKPVFAVEIPAKTALGLISFH